MIDQSTLHPQRNSVSFDRACLKKEIKSSCLCEKRSNRFLNGLSPTIYDPPATHGMTCATRPWRRLVHLLCDQHVEERQCCREGVYHGVKGRRYRRATDVSTWPPRLQQTADCWCTLLPRYIFVHELIAICCRWFVIQGASLRDARSGRRKVHQITRSGQRSRSMIVDTFFP